MYTQEQRLKSTKGMQAHCNEDVSCHLPEGKMAAPSVSDMVREVDRLSQMVSDHLDELMHRLIGDVPGCDDDGKVMDLPFPSNCHKGTLFRSLEVLKKSNETVRSLIDIVG